MIYESGKQHNSMRFENLLISGDVVLTVFYVHDLFILCNNVWLSLDYLNFFITYVSF